MVGNNFVDIGRSSFSAIKHKKHGIETLLGDYTPEIENIVVVAAVAGLLLSTQDRPRKTFCS